MSDSTQAAMNLLTVVYRLVVVVLLASIIVSIEKQEPQEPPMYESECIATTRGKLSCLYWPFDVQQHIKISSSSD